MSSHPKRVILYFFSHPFQYCRSPRVLYQLRRDLSSFHYPNLLQLQFTKFCKTYKLLDSRAPSYRYHYFFRAPISPRYLRTCHLIVELDFFPTAFHFLRAADAKQCGVQHSMWTNKCYIHVMYFHFPIIR